MAGPAPVVYLLYGEDEVSISQYLAKIEAKLGDPGSITLNTSHLDGRLISLDELRNAVSALPFMGARRLVVVTNPLARFDSRESQNQPEQPKQQEQQKRFKELLSQLPDSTALVLVVYRALKENHWLVRWVKSAGARGLVHEFSIKKGEMAGWIQKQAAEQGGRFTPQAAAQLAVLVGDDTRLALQEIQKLIAYANYQRAVEVDDVDLVASAAGQVDIFALVDALGNQDGRRAMDMLQRLLSEQDTISIFGMVVRQFRLLLLAREVLDSGGREAEVTRELGIHPYVAGKISAQARRFTLPVLETIYRRLLDIDEAVKTGQIEGDVALDTLVPALTTQQAYRRR
jgi:DNA polymerase-3 subunit delta